MSFPRLGVVRKSMLTNPLHIKAPLGHSKSRGLSVPGPDFIFGKRSERKDGGVAEVLSSWNVQTGCEDSDQAVVSDFVSLNRDAVKSGMVTAKELSQYRAQRGGARRSHSVPRRQEASRNPAVPDMTFGVPSRPSSPIADILAHEYARRWVNEQLIRDQTNNVQQEERIKASCNQDTRTSLLRRSKRLPVTQKAFTLPQFSQVPAALDTFRDPKARERAFKAHQSNSVSRRGVQGSSVQLCVQKRRSGSELNHCDGNMET